MEDSITFRVDKEAKKLYVIGRDIDLFTSLLASGLYSHQGYEIIYETKEKE
jgi:hypothetical protein